MAMNTEAIKKACESVGGLTALARELGITVGAVHQWTRGYKQVPIDRCIPIEMATNGAVRAEEIRPDHPWHVIRGKSSKQTAA
jgi:DNA-binding transcriptional regulator YdaS (Cro superfamily)